MPARGAYLRRVRHTLANRGLRGFFSLLLYRFRQRSQGQETPASEPEESGPHPFDVAYGVDTTGLLWAEALDATQDSRSKDSHYWATGYYGIAPSSLTAALESLNLPWADYTFIDVGCGKGRALLIASRFPFRGILGVELMPALATVAQANIDKFAAPWRQPSVPIQAIAGDATTFAIPDGPLVLFLYHPFAAPVMKRFLQHVQTAMRTQPRDVVILYANPELNSLLASTRGCTELWQNTFGFSEEDKSASRFGTDYENFSAFRLEAARS